MKYLNIMKLADIKIPEAFANTTPKPEKMEECRQYWNEKSKQDRYIVVNHNNVLIDGYIQYLILKGNGIEEVEIVRRNNKISRWRRKRETDWDIPKYRRIPTTYIYGIHSKDEQEKEYVWRIPNSWKWVSENIQVGDKVKCRTTNGVSPVIITKILVTNKCPFDGVIRKVCSKSIVRNGILVE